MPADPTFERAPGWVWRVSGGSVLVMGPGAAAHQLEAAASLLWSALDEPATVSDLVERSAGRWDGATADPSELAAAAMTELVRAGMVREVPS